MAIVSDGIGRSCQHLDENQLTEVPMVGLSESPSLLKTESAMAQAVVAPDLIVSGGM